MSQTKISFSDLPQHLILEILISGRLNAIDLANIESTSKLFGWGLYSSHYKSVADHAASRLCVTNPIYTVLSQSNQKGLVTKCKGNWKRVLRFLQSVMKHSKDNIEMKKIEKEETVDRNVEYSCGDHAKCPEVIRCRLELKPEYISFTSQVVQVSASVSNAAFVMKSGQVFTCGDNSFFACGHPETGSPICSPKLVEALATVPCKQVATGVFSTVFLTREGHVYTVGGNAVGQLGHGDTVDRQEPTIVEVLKEVGPVEQIAAGLMHVLAVTKDGLVYSFGDGYDLCLGHGDTLDGLQPHVIQAFKSKGVHILHVCAGRRHAVALASNGDVYTWGRGSEGSLGHGDRFDRRLPGVVLSLKNHLAVQICARGDNTFVEVEGSLVYSFGSEFGFVPSIAKLDWLHAIGW